MAYDIYPTRTVKRFFKACRQDEVFKVKLRAAEGDDYLEPKRFMSNKEIILYASMYAGYLIGQGELSKYRELDKQ